MLCPRALCSLIDKPQRQVIQLIESGDLAWCWDVSLNPKRSRKRELRILPAAVAGYMSGRPCSLSFDEVLRLLLPHEGPEILSTDIGRVLNITGEHCYALARRKMILPCSRWHRGRGGAARFTAESFVRFLKTRRVS
jgi:hypothetical protein